MSAAVQLGDAHTQDQPCLGDTLVRLRVAWDWSQRELALRSEVGYTTLRRAEAGGGLSRRARGRLEQALRVPSGSLRNLPAGRTAMRMHAHSHTPEAANDFAPAGAPGSATWHELSWEDDPWAQQFVREHPDGAEFHEIGEAFGRTKQWAAMELESALTKLRALGTFEDVEEWL
jgi:hypothetical protein